LRTCPFISGDESGFIIDTGHDDFADISSRCDANPGDGLTLAISSAFPLRL